MFIALVTYVTVTKRDRQPGPKRSIHAPHAPHPHLHIEPLAEDGNL